MAQRQQKFSTLALSVSLLLALGIWMNATMQDDDYSIMVDVPLTVNLPDNRAIESDLPGSIQVRFQGEGWQLFKMNFSILDRQIAQLPKCDVTISDKVIDEGQDSIFISRSMLSQSMRIPVPVKEFDVLNDSIVVGIGTIVSKTVPVLLRQSIDVREGYRMIGRPQLMPDSVTIEGNQRLLRTIDNWQTQNLQVLDVHSDLTGSVALDDTLDNILRRSIDEIAFDIEVQQEAEFEIEQAPVEIVGAPDSHNFVLRPAYVRVMVRGGIDDILRLQAGDIRVQVQYRDLVENSTGLLVPEVVGPNTDRLEILRPQPHLIHFVNQIEI